MMSMSLPEEVCILGDVCSLADSTQRSIAVGCADLAVLLRRKKDPGRAQWLEGQLSSGLPVTTDPKPSASPLLIKQLRDIV